MNDSWGRPRRRIRRMLGLARPSWHDRHPLPEGWRPRTRIDVAGREVEPWQWLASLGGQEYDGGEWWLMVGLDPDEAAHLILGRWLSDRAGYLEPWELAGIQMQVRKSIRYDTQRVGVAYAAEQAPQNALR